jgi:zinc transport system ATP-binding protein
MGPTINFNNVNLTLGNTVVLDNVNVDVREGTIHCIIGPNGGGKSSLIKSLLGQMPHEGEISVTWNSGQTIGYVPQSLNFDVTLPITVEDLMIAISQDKPVFFGIRKSNHLVLSEALQTVRMDSKRKRLFGQLSGGERQRVVFAQALIPKPDLLILDEPMTGIDPAGEKIITEAVRSLNQEGVTVIWINHDLQCVKEVADEVTCVNRRIVFSGAPNKVLTPERILSLFDAGAVDVPYVA